MRRLLYVVAIFGMLVTGGIGLAALQGRVISTPDSTATYTTPPVDPPAWATLDTNPFRWTSGIPDDTISRCPVGDGEADCLIEWGRNQLDGSLERLDEVVIAISLRTLGAQHFFAGACHDVWHEVGERAGELYALDVIVKHWPDMCHGGLLHGAMNTRAVQLGADALKLEVQDLCQLYDGWAEIMRNDCYHGIGHGFGSIETWDTFFAGCNQTGLVGEAYDWCAAGVMETVVERISTEGLRLDGDDPTAYGEFCAQLDREKDPCWRYIVFPLLATGMTLAEIADQCGDYDETNALRCSFAVGGVAASGWEYGGDDLDLCRAMMGDRASECWKGAARSITRGTERPGIASPRAEDLPLGWRLSLCGLVPDTLSQWCVEMEDAELGDQTDQVAQAESAKRWRERFDLSWPY